MTGADRAARPERDLVGDLSWHRRRPTAPAHAPELITALIGRPAACEVLATDPWTARMLVADQFAAGRVFLVGEAAHVNPPWGGHGFNTSVGDAVNIAWKIAAVEHGWAPPDLLASYEAERRGVAEQTVATAASQHARAGRRPARRRGRHPAGEAVRVLQPRPGARLLLRGLAGDPARPRAAPAADTDHLHGPRRSRAPGCRTPGCPTARRSTTGSAPGSRCSGRPAAAPRLAARARERGIPLTARGPPPGYPWRDEFLLVRPDQHIAWRASDPDGIDLDAATGRSQMNAGTPARNRPDRPR